MFEFVFSDFKKRFLSSLGIVGVLVLSVVFGHVSLWVFGGFLVCALTYEWLALCKIQRRSIFWVIVPIIFFALYNAYVGHVRLSFGLLFAASSIGIFLSWFAWHRRFLWGSLALVYFGVPFVSFFWMLQGYDNAPAILLWVVMVVSGSDIGGYVFGSLLRGPKLIPEVSPNKTWSGFLGSLLTAVLLGGLAYKLLTFQKPPLYISLASLIIALVSVLGDLIESLIKRYHHVKDSGTWMPGHGGVLDRLDGYLFALPVVVWMMSVEPEIFTAFVSSFQEWWDF
jgi:phosphatidate cytidylyltransferase